MKLTKLCICDLHIVWYISIKRLLFKNLIIKSIRIGRKFSPVIRGMKLTVLLEGKDNSGKGV